MYIYIVILCLICIFVNYVVADNRRIKVRKQIIKCGNKGKNITILQISDLHSKVLRTADYIKINNLNYDAIVFTGDTFVDSDKKYYSIINFIKNVKNKKVVLYVDGNNGTKAYSRKDNTLTEFGKRLEKLGIIILKDIYSINDVIFTNYNAITSKILDGDYHGKYAIYDDLNTNMKNTNKFNIGLAHFPLDKKAIKQVNSFNEYYVPSLILAGHLHGGQIRFPFLGAILVPKARKYGFRLFPNQKLVCGLYEDGKVRQYISRGVGATDGIKFLAFRVFNTPEIDLLNIQF